MPTSCPGGSSSGEQPLRSASLAFAYSYSGNWMATWHTPISDGSSPLHAHTTCLSQPLVCLYSGNWIAAWHMPISDGSSPLARAHA